MEDANIVQLYWERDPDAITRTSEKYGSYCTAIAGNILDNVQDVEECVNDTYLQAWHSMPPHRPGRLATFLGKITRNLSFNRYKSIHREKRGGYEMPAVLEELTQCVSGKSSVEQDVEFQELVFAINEFLAELSSEKRRMFVCRYWYADSVSAIARQFGMRENTVSMTLLRLRGKLRSHLIERGFEV